MRCRSCVKSRRSCTARSSSAVRAGPAQQRQVEHVEVGREDRDDVDSACACRTHVRRPGRADPPAGRRRVDRPSRSTSGTSARTKGTIASPPSVRRHHEQVLRAVHHLARRLRASPPSVLDHSQADELVVVELIGIVGGLIRVDIDRQQHAAQGLRPRCGRRPLRSAAAAVRCASGRPSTVSVGRLGSIGDEHRATGEPTIGLVGADLDVTSPRTPCGRPMRPTTTSIGSRPSAGRGHGQVPRSLSGTRPSP